MITLKQIRAPSQFKPDGIGEPLIGVRILVLPDALTPITYPECNRTGTEMLSRLLQARMELAGVRATKPLRGLPLNRAFYMFTVSDLPTAQESIKEVLKELGLLGWAQIAWHDPREEVWRVWHSKSGRFDSPSAEEFAGEKELFARIISAIDAYTNSQDEPAGQ
jgi:hypothetical protein